MSHFLTRGTNELAHNWREHDRNVGSTERLLGGKPTVIFQRPEIGLRIQGGHMHAITNIAGCIMASIVAAELLGYVLHRLMHSGWIPWLSASHMKHHLILYGPLQKQRPSDKYIDATTGEIAIGNIGLEWIIPSALILAIALAVLSLFHLSYFNRACCIGTILMWSFLMFSYLHDRMHIRNFWMERAPVVRRWFARARRLHDIHHHALNNHGLMDKNFGIGFFAFDKLFGTLAFDALAFNQRGYSAAKIRFRILYHE